MSDIQVHSNWLEIDLGAISANLTQLQRISAVRVMAVVKANGYGHGLVPVARRALDAGAVYCGVARLDEALELRAAGIEAPLHVLGETPSARFAEAIANRVTLTVFQRNQIEPLRAAAGAATAAAKVHLKVDTGMSRLGAQVEQAIGLLRELGGLEGVEVEGIFTHYARADEPQERATEQQEQLFTDLLGEITSAGLRPPLVHAANSAAALTRPSSRFDMVRPGIALYGLHPSPQVRLPSGFQPALRWRARLSQIRQVPAGTGISYGHAYVTQEQGRIGVVPVGYGDGYRRVAGNSVLIGGVEVPVRGRVCMDQMMVDLSAVPGAQVGDEVTLIGEQGEHSLTVDDLAARWSTFNYEVVCGLSGRVPRHYKK